jgi:hypothetical protein
MEPPRDRFTVDADPGPDEADLPVDAGAAEPPSRTGPSAPPPLSIDRYLPILAIVAMLGTFVVLPPTIAMTLIGAIWLAGTRLTRDRRLLGLSLTEALAWAATIAIVEFLSIVLLYGLRGGAAGG